MSFGERHQLQRKILDRIQIPSFVVMTDPLFYHFVDVWFLRLIREFEFVTSVVDETRAQSVTRWTRWATFAFGFRNFFGSVVHACQVRCGCGSEWHLVSGSTCQSKDFLIMNMNISWQNDAIVNSPWRLRAWWSPVCHRFHGRQGAGSGNSLSCKMEYRHKSLHKFFSKSAKQGLFLLGQASRTWHDINFGAWMSYLLGNMRNIFDCCRTNTLSCTP